MDDPQESSGVVAASFDPALSDLGGQPVAQADPSASGTAIRRWFRSGESSALAQIHADSPAVARLRRLTALTGNLLRGISFRRPEVAGVEGVTRPLASPPGECCDHSL
jgi:hypothetical protein